MNQSTQEVQQTLVQLVSIKQIARGCNPRTRFDEKRLSELTESICAQGVVQPITLREVEQQKFVIVDGERRFRAAQQAGLEAIPAIVRDIDEEAARQFSLIANAHREELNPIDKAKAYAKLSEIMTQEDIARTFDGGSQESVSSTMALLRLPEYIQDHVAEGRITKTHARTLLAHLDNGTLLNRLLTASLDGASTRDLDRIVENAQTQQIEDFDDAPLNGEIAEHVDLNAPGNRVPGCRANCPCRQKLLKGNGGSTEVCTNPQCHDELKRAAAKQAEDACREELFGLQEGCLSLLDGKVVDVNRVLSMSVAAICLAPLMSADPDTIKQVAGRHRYKIDPKQFHNGDPDEILDMLAGMRYPDVIAFTAEVVLREELRKADPARDNTIPETAKWFTQCATEMDDSYDDTPSMGDIDARLAARREESEGTDGK